MRYGENPHQKASAYQFKQLNQLNHANQSNQVNQLNHANHLNHLHQLNHTNQVNQQFNQQVNQQVHGILSATQHQGKPLSYNNILDAEAALSQCKRI